MLIWPLCFHPRGHVKSGTPAETLEQALDIQCNTLASFSLGCFFSFFSPLCLPEKLSSDGRLHWKHTQIKNPPHEP